MPSLANSIRKSAPLPSMRTRKDGKSPADPLTLPPVQSWEGSTTRRRQRRRAWAGVGIHSDREPSSRSPSCGPGPLRVPRGRRAGLSRPRHTSLRPRSTYVARDTTPFACVPPTQTARRAVPGGEAPPPAASRARALTSAAPFAPVPHTPPHPRLRPRHSDHPVARPADMDPGEVVIGRMTVGFIDPTLARLDLRSNEYFATTGTESAAGSSASSLGPPRRPDPRPRPPA